MNIDWSSTWIAIKLFFKNIVTYEDEHYGFLIVTLTLITAGALIWYATETRRLTKETRKSVMVAEKSISLTKEKEKIDRALDFSERFYSKNLGESISSSIYYLDKKALRKSESLEVAKQEIWWRIYRILSFFDLLAFLITKEKVNYYMVEKEFSDEFIYFFENRVTEIENFINLNKKVGNHIINFNNYFKICKRFDESLDLIEDKENKKILNKLIND